MRICTLSLMTLALLTGCDSSNFGQSCGGEPVLVCPAYEWADVTHASLTPDALALGDLMLMARVQVTLARCDMAPAAHEVAISVLVPEEGGGTDGGSPRLEVFNVLTVADGEDGDAVAGDGMIDVEIINPFTSGIPANRDARLRFEAVSRAPSGCGSGALEIPYRTGRPSS